MSGSVVGGLLASRIEHGLHVGRYSGCGREHDALSHELGTDDITQEDLDRVRAEQR